MALSPYDQKVYDAGFKFIPQTQYLQNPFLIPEDEVTADPNTGAGITTLPVGRDDNRLSYDQVTPDFNRRGVFADPKEYGPGGMYEINPAALGFEFGPQGQVMRAGPGKDLQGQLGPTTTNPRMYGSSLDRAMFRVAGIPAREIADMYDERMQQVPGQDFRNFLKRFTGAQSNFEVARAPGILQEMMGKIPSLTGILSSIGGGGDKSDRSRFAVDNAGFGQGTGRDQFGVFTGGKTLFGKTANYTERMKNEISEIAKNFGYDEEDLLGLDPNTLAALGKRNKFRQTQVIDYVNKLRAKNIEAEYAKQQAELDRQNRIDAERAAGAAANEAMQRQEGGGGGSNLTRSREQGGLGLSASQAQAVSEANRAAGMGGFGLADGGIVDMLEIYD
jgi:hypothetical protein